MFHTPRRFDALLRWARRVGRPAGPSSSGADPTADVRVEHVDDPEAPFRLIRAAGNLGPTSIDRLLDAWANVMAPASLHLDLGDARIDDAHTMHRLEAALDHLERQGITIRLIGIDPQHPVLHS